MDRCNECDFVYDELPEKQIGAALRHLVPQYGTILASDPAKLRAHPITGVWSALEYACHVRDVFEVQRERVELALTKHEPSFEPMGREERVVRDRYNEQDPTDVERELAIAARALAEVFERLSPDELGRRGIYNFPERAPQTIAWIGRHTVHEGRHHLRDIEHVLDAVNDG
jgi:hypothetical protein